MQPFLVLVIGATLGITLSVAIAPKCPISQSQQWLNAGQIIQSCVGSRVAGDL